jgi:hypothetical protein
MLINNNIRDNGKPRPVKRKSVSLSARCVQDGAALTERFYGRSSRPDIDRVSTWTFSQRRFKGAAMSECSS